MTTKYGVFSEPGTAAQQRYVLQLSPSLLLTVGFPPSEWQAELKGASKENKEKKQTGSDKAGFKSGTLAHTGKVRVTAVLSPAG